MSSTLTIAHDFDRGMHSQLWPSQQPSCCGDELLCHLLLCSHCSSSQSSFCCIVFVCMPNLMRLWSSDTATSYMAVSGCTKSWYASSCLTHTSVYTAPHLYHASHNHAGDFVLQVDTAAFYFTGHKSNVTACPQGCQAATCTQAILLQATVPIPLLCETDKHCILHPGLWAAALGGSHYDH